MYCTHICSPAISPLLGIHEVIPVASFYTMEVEMSSLIIVHIPKISDLKVYIFIFFLLLFTLPYIHCHILCLNSENIWITSLSFVSWILYSMGESSMALSIIGMMSLYACSILLADSFFGIPSKLHMLSCIYDSIGYTSALLKLELERTL